MPGPPTPLLNLTLPTVGGDTNAWGGELNGNFTVVDGLAAAAVNNVSTNTIIALAPTLITAYRFTTGASNLTATLPVASTGRMIYISKVDSGIGSVTVLGTIGIFTNYVLVNQTQFVTIMFNGVSWDIIGSN